MGSRMGLTGNSGEGKKCAWKWLRREWRAHWDLSREGVTIKVNRDRVVPGGIKQGRRRMQK